MAARLTAYLVVVIVGVSLIAGLIVGAQRDDDGPVDLIVHNGLVFTGDDPRPADVPQAVAVRANQILKVGSSREILRLQRPQTLMIDARGGTVLPGFNDAHLHLVEGGLSLRGVGIGGSLTPEDEEQALFAAIEEAQRHGITSMQDADGEARHFEILDAARKTGAVDMRIYSALPVHGKSTDADVASLDGVLKRYPDDPLFKAGAARVVTDHLDADALNKVVRLLDARGWQVMIEADAEADAAQARTAFAHAERSNPNAPRERRHRLEHQPRHFTRAGRKIALGSDWPRGPMSPMRVLQEAVSRYTIGQALQAYTVNGAYASFDEQRKGFIKPGMLADIVVLSDDLFSLPPEKFESVSVAYTIFDGRVVYPRNTRPSTN